MPDSNDIANGRIGLDHLDSTLNVINMINENGDLCKDGLRAVNHINQLATQVIDAIEADEGIEGVADIIHEATNLVKQGLDPA